MNIIQAIRKELTRPSKWDDRLWTGFFILLIAALFLLFGIITGYGVAEVLR